MLTVLNMRQDEKLEADLRGRPKRHIDLWLFKERVKQVNQREVKEGPESYLRTTSLGAFITVSFPLSFVV